MKQPESTPTLSDITDLESPSAIMMIGIPGSGKSYLARNLGQLLDVPVLSLDAIREELTGSVESQAMNPEARGLLNLRAHRLLEAGSSVVLDNTHAFYEQRIQSIEICRELGAASVAGVFVDTRYSVAASRNRLRKRHVPEDVIQTMHGALRSKRPSVDDGFDLLVEVRNSDR